MLEIGTVRLDRLADALGLLEIRPAGGVVEGERDAARPRHAHQLREEGGEAPHLLRVLPQAGAVDAERDQVEVVQQPRPPLGVALQREAVGDDADVPVAQVVPREAHQLPEIPVQERLPTLDPQPHALPAQVRQHPLRALQRQPLLREPCREDLRLTHVAVRAAQVAGGVHAVVAEERRHVDALVAHRDLRLHHVLEIHQELERGGEGSDPRERGGSGPRALQDGQRLHGILRRGGERGRAFDRSHDILRASAIKGAIGLCFVPTPNKLSGRPLLRRASEPAPCDSHPTQ